MSAPTDDLEAIRQAGIAAQNNRGMYGTAARTVTKMEQWRTENPFAVKRWSTTHGVCVAYCGMAVYYGACARCRCLVTHRRPVGYKSYSQGNGRWPKHCNECRAQLAEEHNDSARKRMAALREKRRRGRPLRQGVTPNCDPPVTYVSIVRKQIPMFCPVCSERVLFATVRPR